jgi:flagellar biosynthetic protein FliP
MFSPSLDDALIETSVQERPQIGRLSLARGPSRPTPDAAGTERRSTRRFFLHYAEMVAVMFLGMYVLMGPTGTLLGVLGTSWSGLSPAMNMFVMALTMTVPMIGWMRVRGHAWRPNAEMAASMLLPTFVVMVALGLGLAGSGALMIPEHGAMLTCMLLAMLLRRDEYSGATHAHCVTRRAVAA